MFGARRSERRDRHDRNCDYRNHAWIPGSRRLHPGECFFFVECGEQRSIVHTVERRPIVCAVDVHVSERSFGAFVRLSGCG
jgi:hypothetical protein